MDQDLRKFETAQKEQTVQIETLEEQAKKIIKDHEN
jgi:hypothetical protein